MISPPTDRAWTAPAAHGAEAAEDLRPRPRMVYVIDDDPDVRATLACLLADEGYDVVAAANGREALSALATGPLPSLILLDAMMPIMNGRQFREAQLADPRLRALPVALVTAGRVEPQVDAIRPDAVLCKPIDLMDLLALVLRYAGPPAAASAEPADTRGPFVE